VETLRVFTLSVTTSSLEEAQVSEATTKLTPRPARTEVVEARHWIERQLRWERTLETLRGDRRTAAKAA
jgi:hypothetical protein